MTPFEIHRMNRTIHVDDGDRAARCVMTITARHAGQTGERNDRAYSCCPSPMGDAFLNLCGAAFSTAAVVRKSDETVPALLAREITG